MDYAVLNNDTTELTDGWYVVSEDTAIDHRLVVKGSDVNLLLSDGVPLNAAEGMTVTDDSTFNIWSESHGESAGSLNIDNVQDHFAVIGGEDGTGGNITVNGGHISVKAVQV